MEDISQIEFTPYKDEMLQVVQNWLFFNIFIKIKYKHVFNKLATFQQSVD